jgi:hypothetical protein
MTRFADDSLTLSTDSVTFDDFHKSAEGRGEFTKVDKAKLRLLLMDHSAMVAKLKDKGVEVQSWDGG